MGVAADAEIAPEGGEGPAGRVDATRPDKRRGERTSIPTLTREEFLARLVELGIRPGADLFSEARSQRSDRGSLSVLVTEKDEGVVVGASVWIDPWGPESQDALVGEGSLSENAEELITGSDGLASRWNLEPGEYYLSVAHPQFEDRSLGTLEIPAGEPTFIEVVLERSGAVVGGIVVDEDGAPLGDALVTAEYYSEGSSHSLVQGLSRSDGVFTLAVREGTSNRLTATLVGYHDALAEHVPAGYRDVVMILEAADTLTIRGWVAHGEEGEALARFQVDGETFEHPSGEFEVERTVAEEPLAMVFSAAGHRDRTLLVDVSESRSVDLGRVGLESERELRGIVLLDSEEGPQPVAGAEVRVTEASDPPRIAFTSGEGAFAVEGLAAEQVQLDVTAAGAAPHHSLVSLLESEPTYVEVLLSTGDYTAQGLVLDAASEEPLGQALVEVVEVPGLSTVTDAEGHFELAGIPMARFTLRASASGYDPETSGLLDAEEGGGWWEARLDPSGLRVRLTAAGAPLPAGVGVVLWRQVEPTLEAALAAQASLSTHRFEAQTDEQGHVTFAVEPGSYFIQVPDYRLNPTPVVVPEEGGDWVDLAVPGVTRLEGRISQADGSPVAGTSLWLHSGDQDYSTMVLVHTDASGHYVLPNLAPRPYALSIIKSSADQSAQHVREFTGSGAPNQLFDVVFPPLTASIRGRVVDENGVGRAGVMVGCEYLDAPHRSILAGWTGTDGEGRFLLPRLEPGRHIVRTAWTEDETVFSSEIVLAAGEERTLELVAPHVTGRHVRGYMIAPDGGPLGGSFLFATDSQGHQNGNYFSTMDWAYACSFDVIGLHPGGYTLTLTAMGCRQQSIPVAVSSDVSGLVVVMERE